MSDLEDKIRRRAYELWEREGRTGNPEDHWRHAEHELTSEQARDTGSLDRPAATVEDAPPAEAVAAADAAPERDGLTGPEAGEPSPSTSSRPAKKGRAPGQTRKRPRSG